MRDMGLATQPHLPNSPAWSPGSVLYMEPAVLQADPRMLGEMPWNVTGITQSPRLRPQEIQLLEASKEGKIQGIFLCGSAAYCAVTGNVPSPPWFPGLGVTPCYKKSGNVFWFFFFILSPNNFTKMYLDFESSGWISKISNVPFCVIYFLCIYFLIIFIYDSQHNLILDILISATRYSDLAIL